MSLLVKSTIVCPLCWEDLLADMEWKPPAGLDPKMRKFRCTRCNCDIYIGLFGKKTPVGEKQPPL